MALFKIMDRPYDNVDAVEKTLAYIIGNNTPEEKVYAVGGIGVDYGNYENAVSQYKIVKKIWNKSDKRQVLHFIVSFEDGRERRLNLFDIAALAYPIGQILSKGEFQIMWAVHINTEHTHLHYIVNSVGYMTGKKYHMEKDEPYFIRQEINRLILPMLYSSEEIMEMYKNAF